MEVNLLRAVKYRVMDEIRYAIQEHEVYRDKVECYHKFPYKDRPQMGVLLRNTSATRIKLSADDHAGTLKSFCSLARAENREDKFIDWVWEDAYHTTDYMVDEDVSNQCQGTTSFGTNRFFYVQKKPIRAGFNDFTIADNFRQIMVKVNGIEVLAECVDGKKGLVVLNKAPAVGSLVQISYYYSIITPPGRYYIEITSPGVFVIDPLYFVTKETVIEHTTGTELTAQLEHGGLYGDFDILYTMKNDFSVKLDLVKGTDYTVTTSGAITFLTPLIPDTTLYADYRWAGARMGPFNLPSEFHYVNNVLPGISICFSNQFDVGNRMVIIVYPDREPAAAMSSGHYDMTFDIEVFARDPVQLPDLTDHIVSWIWSNRRLKLMSEGLTINQFEPSGESEDTYDPNTEDLYYKNMLTLQIMSEWKKFNPYLYALRDYDYKLREYLKTSSYILTDDNQLMELSLVPVDKPFEVKYPSVGYPRYF